jgi:hypothetical protein
MNTDKNKNDKKGKGGEKKSDSEMAGTNRLDSYFLFVYDCDFFFLLSVFICVHPWFHSDARAGIAAAGLYGYIAAAAKRTF